MAVTLKDILFFTGVAWQKLYVELRGRVEKSSELGVEMISLDWVASSLGRIPGIKFGLL